MANGYGKQFEVPALSPQMSYVLLFLTSSLKRGESIYVY